MIHVHINNDTPSTMKYTSIQIFPLQNKQTNHLQFLAFMVSEFFQEVINTKLCKFILEVNSEIHVLDTVHHNIHKLHACHLYKKKVSISRQ